MKDKHEKKNIDMEKGKLPKRTFTPEETSRSAKEGRLDAAELSNSNGSDFPALISLQLDKGDNVLNPMADKRMGIKRLEKLSEESERKKREDAD